MGDFGFLLVAGLAFISVAGLGWVFVGDSGAARKKRLKTVTASAAAKAGPRRRSSADIAQTRRRQVQDTLKQIEERQKKERRTTLSLAAQLRQAGLSITPTVFWIASLCIGLALAGFLLFQARPLWMAGGVGFVAGLGLPRWFLGVARKRRMKKFTEEFVNAIDIIVRGVKAGLPLNECLKMIVREVGDPVAGEFRKLVEEQAAGVPIDESLGRIYLRMPLPELNFFSTVLIIQQKTGGNLAEALSNLSTVLRSRKMMREKIGALSAEAKASAMIIGVLPPGVMGLVYVTSPAYMTLLFTDPLGQMMLAGGATWMAVGIFIMRRMINFKF